MEKRERSREYQYERAMLVLAGCVAVTCLIIPIFAAQSTGVRQFASVVGVALVVACAAMLTGGFLGFLFGIPRTLQGEASRATQDTGKPANDSKDQPQTTFAHNTNLEQISDWLTKILVGVGLTQITSIPKAITEFADYVGPGLGDFPNSSVFAIALLLFSLIVGFLISYLWTSLHLAELFRQADATIRLAAVESKLDMLDTDSRALGLVSKLLSPAAGGSLPPQQEIDKAVAAASTEARAQIFREAARVRSETWRNEMDKPRMERTIPVFRALISSDTDKLYHANLGQLGFALKDQREPDYPGAIAALTEAIRRRGEPHLNWWLLHYEIARALCNIELEGAFPRSRSGDEAKGIILSDLNAVFKDTAATHAALEIPTIKDWMHLNEVPEPGFMHLD
jgi:hypothetical protein